MMTNWVWETIRKEVDEAHRRFFLKRGIDPSNVERSFLFGSGRKFESSPETSDQPIEQYPQDFYPTLDSDSQMSADGNEKTYR